MIRRAPATVWRVIFAFSLTFVVAIVPMIALLASEGGLESAGPSAESLESGPVLLSLVAAGLTLLATATALRVNSRRSVNTE